MIDPRSLAPGDSLRYRPDGSTFVVDRRKDDDSGWWLTDGGGVADFVLESSGDWIPVERIELEVERHDPEPEDTVPADLAELEEDGIDFAADDEERKAAHAAAVEAEVAGNPEEVDDAELFYPEPELGGEG